MPWYSMTAIFHWKQDGDTLPKYERRVTICSAPDEEAATKSLLREAREYPAFDNIVFLDDYCIQEIDEPPSEEPIEVASELTIGVDLATGFAVEPCEFLERNWHASKIESCEDFGFRHVWHNLDNLTSGCYNCKVVREGRLWEENEK
jgi:hypothetical protein